MNVHFYDVVIIAVSLCSLVIVVDLITSDEPTFIMEGKENTIRNEMVSTHINISIVDLDDTDRTRVKVIVSQLNVSDPYTLRLGSSVGIFNYYINNNMNFTTYYDISYYVNHKDLNNLGHFFQLYRGTTMIDQKTCIIGYNDHPSTIVNIYSGMVVLRPYVTGSWLLGVVIWGACYIARRKIYEMPKETSA